MFEGITIAPSVKHPLRDIITDDESGLAMEVVTLSKEMFLPVVHLAPHQYGFFISFTNNPLNRYSGIYFVLGAITEEFTVNLQDILIVATFYCNLKRLPQPQGVMPVTHIG